MTLEDLTYRLSLNAREAERNQSEIFTVRKRYEAANRAMHEKGAVLRTERDQILSRIEDYHFGPDKSCREQACVSPHAIDKAWTDYQCQVDTRDKASAKL